MGSIQDVVGWVGLRFFGKMSAAVSHELKNVLAIINENAGLLEDIIMMVEKGKPLDEKRIATLAGRVKKQIARGDGIVKDMNRLAHSIDDPLLSVDVRDILAFTTEIASKSGALRGVTLEVNTSENPVIITTAPFFLGNIIWLCLEFAAGVAGDGKRADIITEKTDNGARIIITQLAGLENDVKDRFPGENGHALLNALGAQLVLDREAGELILSLPQEIEGESLPGQK